MEVVLGFLTDLIFVYGPFFAFLIIIIIVILLIAYQIYKRKVLNNIDARTNQKLENIKNDLQKERDEFITTLKGEIEQNLESYKKDLEKEMELLFINEPVRKELSIRIGLESNKIGIELYKEIYNLFFEVLYKLAQTGKLVYKNDQAKIEEIFDSLNEKLTYARIKVFVNAVHAPRLTDFLLNAVIGLRHDVTVKHAELSNQNYKESHEDYLYDASSELNKAQKWLIENFKTNMTPKELEIVTNEINSVNDKKEQLIKELG